MSLNRVEVVELERIVGATVRLVVRDRLPTDPARPVLGRALRTEHGALGLILPTSYASHARTARSLPRIVRGAGIHVVQQTGCERHQGPPGSPWTCVIVSAFHRAPHQSHCHTRSSCPAGPVKFGG